MINPLDVERRYQSLLVVLAYPATPLQKITACEQFLSIPDADTVGYESYVRDCLPRLKELLDGLPTFGMSPAPLHTLYHTMQRLSAAVQDLAKDELFGYLLRELQARLAELYLYAGDCEQAGVVLSGDVPDSFPTLSPGDGGESPQQMCQRWLAEAELQGGPNVHTLRDILSHWKAAGMLSGICCYVPVVEHPLVEQTTDGSYGGLRLLEFHVTGSVEGDRDELYSDVAVFGAQDVQMGPWDVAARAARTMITQMHPRIAERYIKGHVKFRGRQSLHEGGSADLALAALVVAGILHETGQREQYRLQPTVAITGEVDGAGTVMPVEGGTLRQKIDAVWFSPVEALVVPREQQDVAEAHTQELEARYPHRRLDIVGVRELREVFYDARAVERSLVSLVSHVARLAWRGKARIVAGIATIALGLVLLWLVVGPIDREPADVEFHGQLLTVKNKFGEIISEVPIDRKSREHILAPASWGASAPRRLGLLPGGKTVNPVVVFLRFSRPDLNGPDELRCWDVDARRVRWDWRPNPGLQFPHKSEGESTVYNLNEIQFLDIDRDGKEDILITANHGPSFPSLLVAVDRETGREKARYVHIGHIMDMALADLDRDGYQEVILCGVNNAYRSAFAAVLGPRYLNGCSPTRNEYVCANVPPALEKIYLLIPRTAVGALSMKSQKNNSASMVVPESEQGLVTVRVDDGVVETDTRDTLTASLNYTFDCFDEPAGDQPG